MALLLVSAANLAAPWLVRLAVDDLDHGPGAAQDNHDWMFAVLGLVGVAAGRGLFNFAQGYLAERASQGVAFDLRDGLFAHIQRLSFSYYDRAQTGELLTRLTNDVEQVRTFVGTGVVQMAASLVMLVGCATLLFVIDPLLAAVALGAIAPIFYTLRVFVRRVGPLFGKVQIAIARLSGVLQEDLHGLKVVRAFSAERREAERYRKVNDELRDLNLGVIDAVANNFPFINLFANLGTLAVIGFGGMRVMGLWGGHLTIGELIAFNGYLGFLLLPIMTMGFLSAQMTRANTSAERVFELLDAPLEVTDAPGATPLSPLDGRVEFRDVRFRYAGSEQEILRGASFAVEPGQLVALLGTTGAGKSTVINLIPRFYDATGGAVLIDGRDVRDITLASLRSQIGVVLQEALLFSGTVRDNIAYGRPQAADEEVAAAARAAQAEEFIAQLPAGYATVVGERGVGLSGGQRQRIAIARALLTDPRLLILDDSTSAVDAQTEAAIQEALDRLMRDSRRTAFVIAQRISTVRDADLILVLDAGRIVAAGRHEELLATSRLYHEIPRLADPARSPDGAEGRGMRWQGIEVLAGQKQRAAHRGAVARRLVRELSPHAPTLAVAGVLIVIAAVAQASAPALVAAAIDEDIVHPDGAGLARHMALLFGVYLVSALGAAGTGAARGQRRATRARLAARAPLRSPAGAAGVVVRQAARRRAARSPLQRRGHAQPAGLAGADAAAGIDAGTGRHPDRDVAEERAPGAGLLHHHPGDAGRHRAVRRARPHRLPQDARDGGPRHRRHPGGDRRSARGAGLQPHRDQHRPLPRAQRRQPRRQRGRHRHLVGLLAHDRRALHAGDGDGDRLRRLPGVEAGDVHRAAGRLPDLRADVLPAGAAGRRGVDAGAVSARGGGAHLRGPRRGARSRRPARGGGAGARGGPRRVRARVVRLRPGAAGAARRQLRHRPGADGGAGGQDGARARPPSPRWWRASTTPPKGRCASTGTTCGR